MQHFLVVGSHPPGLLPSISFSASRFAVGRPVPGDQRHPSATTGAEWGRRILDEGSEGLLARSLQL